MYQTALAKPLQNRRFPWGACHALQQYQHIPWDGNLRSFRRSQWKDYIFIVVQKTNMFLWFLREWFLRMSFYADSTRLESDSFDFMQNTGNAFVFGSTCHVSDKFHIHVQPGMAPCPSKCKNVEYTFSPRWVDFEKRTFSDHFSAKNIGPKQASQNNLLIGSSLSEQPMWVCVCVCVNLHLRVLNLLCGHIQYHSLKIENRHWVAWLAVDPWLYHVISRICPGHPRTIVEK